MFTVLWSAIGQLGSESNNDGDGNETVTKKVNAEWYTLYDAYSVVIRQIKFMLANVFGVEF